MTIKQKGISLIELMVSLAIGLILILALGSVYMTANRNAKERDTDTRMDEAARQVFERLGQDIALAGYVDIFDKNGTTLIGSSVAKLSNAEVQRNLGRLLPAKATYTIQTPFHQVFANELVNQGIDTSIDDVQGLNGTDNTLNIRYQAVSSDDAHSSLRNFKSATANSTGQNSGVAEDCVGIRIPNRNNIRAIKNTYELKNGNFVCTGSNAALINSRTGTQAIVSDLSDLKFRYLVTNQTSSSEGNLYNSYSGLYTNDILSASDVNSTRLKWAGVIGVEVCIVVGGVPQDNVRRSEIAAIQPNTLSCTRNTSNDGYVNGPARKAGDTRLYRRYIKIFNIPNALYYIP